MSTRTSHRAGSACRSISLADPPVSTFRSGPSVFRHGTHTPTPHWSASSNTLVVSGLAVVTATLFGFIGGAALSVAKPPSAAVRPELGRAIRNTPQLLQILFIYTVTLRTLPAARDSLSLGGFVFLNVRGLFLPAITNDPRSCRIFCSLPIVGFGCSSLGGGSPSRLHGSAATLHCVCRQLHSRRCTHRLPFRNRRAAT